MTEQEALDLAVQDATDAIKIARTEPGPVTWITGNRYMPPLRAFGHAESAWEVGPDQWLAYEETFELELEKNDVLLCSSEDDNALYVVDLRRWQYRDDGIRHETLDGEWEMIEGD